MVRIKTRAVPIQPSQSNHTPTVTTQHSATMLTGSSVMISGGSFIQNNVMQSSGGIAQGRKLITDAASGKAFFDSAANQIAEEQPDSDRDVQASITNWIMNQSDPNPLLCVSGESGTRASLITQNIAKWCDSQNILLTTFFFSQNDTSRNNAEKFIPTLAYGVVQSIPASQDFIYRIAENDPHIISRSPQTQFTKLLLEPLAQLYTANDVDQSHDQFGSLPFVIVIDALDECENPDREKILLLFQTFLKFEFHNDRGCSRLPWKILISSKSDQTISHLFDNLFGDMVKCIVLSGRAGDSYDMRRRRDDKERVMSSSTISSTTPTLVPEAPVTPKHVALRAVGLPSSKFRLLSIDGGGIRGLSTLIILGEIMHRVKVKLDLPEPPHPWQVFDLAGGTGTGGLVVIMLFRLQMSVKDAIDAYAKFTEHVFSEKKWMFQDGAFKASRLEEAIVELISGQLRISKEEAMNVQMVDMESPMGFVCATPTPNQGQPVFFRTFEGRTVPRNSTIIDAARVTCTKPTLFRSAQVTNGRLTETFVDAGLLCNNPINYVLKEAASLTNNTPAPSCIVSLGTGLENVIQLSQPDPFQRILPSGLIKVFKSIAEDCEKTAEDAAQRLGQQDDFYFRFNVKRGMQSVSLAEWDKLGEVMAHTNAYLQGYEVDHQVNKLVEVLLRP